MGGRNNLELSLTPIDSEQQTCLAALLMDCCSVSARLSGRDGFKFLQCIK